MNSLSLKKLTASILIMFIFISVCEAQSFDRPQSSRPGKAAKKGPLKTKKVKVIQPKAVSKKKKEAETKKKKRDKDYANYVKENQKRSIRIQTPEVQKRMKQNVKDANSSYKMKKKSNSNRTRKAGQKYH